MFRFSQGILTIDPQKHHLAATGRLYGLVGTAMVTLLRKVSVQVCRTSICYPMLA